jgi:hypothetical protein
MQLHSISFSAEFSEVSQQDNYREKKRGVGNWGKTLQIA